jgi:cytochrome c oxidase subunit 2
MAIAIALILLVVGTVLFHILSPWWFTPIASNWEMMDTTVKLTFWVTGIVFIAVNLFLAYAVIRYRNRKGVRPQVHYEPENRKLEWWLTVGTAVGVVAMLAPGLAVWGRFVTPPEDAAVVEVLGQQWNWSYRFPGTDGALGKTDPKLISLDNPFGIVPDDPAGADDVLVPGNELHLPVNQPVKLVLRSKDVNHQFAVPQFRVKMDMVPGMVTYFWFTPTRTGSFDALCEQLCGLAHFAMRGRVVVDEQEQFRSWLAQHQTYASSKAALAGDPQAGEALFAPCTACHGAQGEGNRDLNAPKLSGQASWYLARQLHDFKNGIRGAHENDIYGKQMIPFATMLADDEAVRNVVAYIATLPDARPAETIVGDPKKGRATYENCSACHGVKGEGVWSTYAPRLANMSDWYLQRQLQNFRDGIRGTHPQDFYGAQMRSIAKSVRDDRVINDLIAYMQTM